MESLFQLKLKGYKLILAHPERYLYWKDNLQNFEQLKTFDLYFQINSLSLLGYYGSDVKKLSNQLLEANMYDFIGTDTHKMDHINFMKSNPLQLKNNQINQLEIIIQANQIFDIISK